MNPSRVVAEVSLSQLRRNLETLRQVARRASPDVCGAVAMVKANAYGHGLVGAAHALENSRFALALGVAAMEEGAELRAAGVRKPVWVFSGSGLSSAEASPFLFEHGLTPIVHRLEDLREILEPRNARLVRTLGFHLKVNTGMNRLGIEPTDFSLVRALLKKAGVRPQGLCTHFASAEEPKGPITRAQVQLFAEAVREFSSFGISYIHSANSAAILGGRHLATSRLCNVIRPGLALYGYTGGVLSGSGRAFKPALKLKAQVVSVRRLRAGEIVGYGATYRVRRSMDEAVLAIGYGDGLRRSLSNKQLVLGAGRARREVAVLGRVSMDLVSLGMKSKPGTWVTLLGEGEQQGNRMAKDAGTIVYEILTAISARVPRVYR